MLESAQKRPNASESSAFRRKYFDSSDARGRIPQEQCPTRRWRQVQEIGEKRERREGRE